jgi:hypothetical protein
MWATNWGREGGGMKMTINCKRGGHLITIIIIMGGRRGEVASSSLLSSSHKDDDMGRERGRG